MPLFFFAPTYSYSQPPQMTTYIRFLLPYTIFIVKVCFSILKWCFVDTSDVFAASMVFPLFDNVSRLFFENDPLPEILILHTANSASCNIFLSSLKDFKSWLFVNIGIIWNNNIVWSSCFNQEVTVTPKKYIKYILWRKEIWVKMEDLKLKGEMDLFWCYIYPYMKMMFKD